MKTQKKEVARSEKQAKAQLDSVLEMVLALEDAREANNDDAIEEAEQSIREDALDVEVRSGWHAPDGERHKPEEYKILLCTGGPAC
ncbi:MAG: hypothetical protein PHY56_04120 [Candidatus Omnitrophica bacterium]|nr:hypothetical protein [Candidatus Omnitrophota bacterium]